MSRKIEIGQIGAFFGDVILAFFVSVWAFGKFGIPQFLLMSGIFAGLFWLTNVSRWSPLKIPISEQIEEIDSEIAYLQEERKKLESQP